MSKILNFLGFVIWVVSTLVLVISIIGIVVVMDCEDDWYGIGKDLVNGFKEENNE